MQPDVPSPCISICRLDTAGTCTGCLRTVQEIAAWSTMTPDDKRRVLARIRPMREAAGLRKPGNAS